MVMKHLKYIALILFVWLGAACEQLPLPNTELTIKSEIVTEVTANSAVIEVEFNPTAATIQTVTACYTGELKKEMTHVKEGVYRVELKNLQSDTEYYVYYEVSNVFSTAVLNDNYSFKTAKKGEKPNPTVTPEYVDLGLPSGVKWATFNVGATKPEDYGDYFAWGETEPKTNHNYDWTTYKWCNGSYNTLTKYNTDSEYGVVDNKKILESSDDAATANWGGDWRMPSIEEWNELFSNSSLKWEEHNGVSGVALTSVRNGNSIFLPAAGVYHYNNGLISQNTEGYYRTNSLDESRGTISLGFSSNGSLNWYANDRCFGQPVRPVYGPQSEQTTAPTVVTSAVTQITETSAVAGGNVTSDGGASVTERGVVYSTSTNPTTASNKVISGSGMGAFTGNLTGLQPNTTYYVRAYAANSKGTSYGEEVSFTTNEEVIATPEYVDLGLSVKWATFNVGANKPEDYGDYFAWGETEPKSTYSWSNYKWCRGSETTLTKYCNHSGYGTVDNKTTLELSDDVAAVNWGGKWRMPTDAEMAELRDQCTWTWTIQNGVNGYEVTSNSNGNSIFLPAAGWCYAGSGEPSYVGSHGDYLLSSQFPFTPGAGRTMYFYSTNVYIGGSDRCEGHPVRPVYGDVVDLGELPTISTLSVTNITETTAVAGVNITSDGGTEIFHRGVVYNTHPNPTISDSDDEGSYSGGTGSFTFNLTGLQPATTYYVRAYARNDQGTAYGEEVSFTTQIQKPTTPYFSVSETKNVTFSSGNLQYHPANNKWRFAENQTDYIGDANSNCSSSYNGWLDLFGWSTSATNFGVSTSTSDSNYSGSFVDWGTNQIGADAPNTWRTLTEDEWEYLLNTRPNASSLKGVAQVNGVNGLILLPDNWVCPAGVTFKSGFHSSYGVDYYAAYQTFTAEQWSKLESAGAVFLPAAGYRHGSTVSLVQDNGDYWSATENTRDSAYYLSFASGGAGKYSYYRRRGHSVRLVKDL